ncbi:polysaccharide deacetylase family protein [Paenibacillus plantiphilus]|nr:polysaccharide deacetylase family protein [Paenibacillus plantiphilus]
MMLATRTARTITTLLLALLLMVGCSTTQKETSNSGTGNTPDPSQESSQPDGQTSPETPPTEAAGSEDEPTAQPEEDPPAKDDEPAQTEAKEKLYRMNAAYRFEPIDKETSDKVVLLTFDDGPKEAEMIDSMLDTLDKHKAKAIFFVNGYRVKQHPELLKKIADRGQTIGNHSWDHIDLKKQTKEEIEKQLGDVQTIVKETIGNSPVFFRPPFGSGGDKVKQIAREHGMLFMTWSNGSLDWDKSTKDKPDKVISNVMEQLHPGANILMHELPWTDKALDTLLAKLEEKGYSFIDPATIDLGLDEARNAK